MLGEVQYLFNHWEHVGKAIGTAIGGFAGGVVGVEGAGACMIATSAVCTPLAPAIVGGGVIAGGYAGGEAGASIGRALEGFATAFGSWVDSLMNSRQTPDQQTLGEIVRDQTKGGRVPLTNGQADTILGWGKEVGVQGIRDDRGTNHWQGGEHIHVPGSGLNHIPVDTTKK